MTRCSENSECIGPFVIGEKPAPLRYQYLDSSGAPLVITGYAVRFLFREEYGVVITRNGNLINAGAEGIVEYLWIGDEFPTPGHYLAELWVGNGTNRFASVKIEWDARPALGPVPAI